MCADLGAHLPKKAVERLCEVPVVSIETAEGPQAFISDVVLPGVLDAMECTGTFYRMDNVPIHARSFCDPPFDFTKSNEDTCIQLRNAVEQKLAAREKEEAEKTGVKPETASLTKEEFGERLDKLVSRNV
jgi:formylmethanofuran dehydrogenase subunit B